MTKRELIREVMYETGLNLSDSKDAVDATFKIIANRLISGEDIHIQNFATFKILDKPAHAYRNTTTGEMCTTKEGKRVKVTMSETIMKEIDPAFRPKKS